MGLAVEKNRNRQAQNVLSLDVHGNTSRLITQNMGRNESNNKFYYYNHRKNMRKIYGIKSKISVSS